MASFVEGTKMETELCCRCGIVFAMPADYQRRRRDDHAMFYCPAGHPQHYTGETEEQKLRRQLERKDAEVASALDRASRAIGERERAIADRDQAAKAHRKMRVRVANGVCPCCNRSFGNLREHMRLQHPEFGDHQTLLALRTAFGMTQHQVADEAGVRAVGYVSNYERGRPVPVQAKRQLDRWVENQSEVANG